MLNALSQEIRGPAGELLGAYGIAPGSLRAHMQALRSVARPEVRTASAATDTNTYTRDLVDQARSNAFGPTNGEAFAQLLKAGGN